jgi:hypothetical protein
MVQKQVSYLAVLVLSGCSLLPPTEHPAPNGTIDRWQVSCSNTGVERRLLEKNLRLTDQARLEQDAVARQKVGIINQKMLDSDELCGQKSR